MPPVTTAVVPVAGRGTRLHPVTRALPKEMLPIGGKPVVEHVVDELAANGITDVVFVTAEGKEAIGEHFTDQGRRVGDDTSDGATPGDRDAASGLRPLTHRSVIQSAPRGLGDAVLQAEPLTGDAPFAVALGDVVLGTRRPPLVISRLAAALEQHDAACAIAVRDVPLADTRRYGIVVARGDRDVTRVEAIVEKPDPADAPSALAVTARYVMTPAIYDALRSTPIGTSGELELTDAIARLIADGHTVVALRIGTLERHDVGTHETYARAFLDFALTDPEHGDALRTHARRLLDGA